jgi:hypothetical protein
MMESLESMVVRFVRKPKYWLTWEEEAEGPLGEVQGKEGTEMYRRKA